LSAEGGCGRHRTTTHSTVRPSHVVPNSARTASSTGCPGRSRDGNGHRSSRQRGPSGSERPASRRVPARELLGRVTALRAVSPSAALR
jgi:hypothetical protein